MKTPPTQPQSPQAAESISTAHPPTPFGTRADKLPTANRPTDIFLNISLVTLLSLSAWLWSGLRIAYIPYFSGATLLLLIVTLICKIQIHRHGTLRPLFTRIDPIVPIGILFLVYLGVQAWNGGRFAYFDVGDRRWVYGPPPHPHLPSSYNRAEAFRVMQWFWVAWGIAITTRFLMRHGKREHLQRSIIALLLNAGALSIFGLFTYFVTPRHMFGVVEASHRFFASFPYVNHAAAFFVMMAAVAAGFLLREILYPKKRKRRPPWIALYTVLTFLCVVGANFSFSRAGIILAWSLTALGAIYGLCKSWQILKPAARANMVAATIAAVAVFYFFISGFGSDDIRRRFTVRQPRDVQFNTQLARVNLDLGNRIKHYHAGWLVFQDHWKFGTGGWGYRYNLALYADRVGASTIMRGSGSANVHNDPIQFLSEFGVVGSSILLLGLGVLIVPLFSKSIWHDPLTTFTAIGLVLVYIFSIVDLPYRCPAVLWTWTMLLAWLPASAIKIKPRIKNRG